MTFEEMIGQKAVVQTLRNAVKNDRVAQAYIFSGMRGVGKTTAARILAKALNCLHGPTPTPCNECEFCKGVNDDRSLDVLEIDGASNRGIEEVRSLREGVKYKPLHGRYKVIIIDEVHMLTREAFNALLKTLEEPPAHTVFIFATTEFQKVPATILSRCQHFEFKKISQRDIINHLIDITQKEKITISSYGLNLIARDADGSLRDAQSLLDQAVAFSGNNISDDDLKEILGTITPDLLFQFSSMILEEKPENVFVLVESIIEKGYDLRFFYKELIEHFRNLLLVQSLKNPQDILPFGEEDIKQLKAEAEKASSEDFLRYLIVLQDGEQGLKFSSHPRIYLEALLVKLCHFKKVIPLKNMIDEFKKLKSQLLLSQTGDQTTIPAFAKVSSDEDTPPSETISNIFQNEKKNFDSQVIAGSDREESIKKVKEIHKKKGKDATEIDTVLSDPSIQSFMTSLNAKVVSVESIKKTKK